MENLRIKSSNSEPSERLPFNDWVMKLGVSRGYVQPTNYFQGNPSSGYVPLEEREGYTFIGYVGRKLKELINQ
jgi:hypothetical protein